MLAIAGGDSRIEISTLTDDQKALHTAKVNELLNMDKLWCGGGGRQTAVATSSLNTLGIKTEIGWIYKVRLVARGFEQTVSFLRYRFSTLEFGKAHDFARTSHDSCN